MLLYAVLLLIINFTGAISIKDTKLSLFDKSGLNENFKNNSQLLYHVETNIMSPFICLSTVLKNTDSQTISYFKLNDGKIICEGFKNKAFYLFDTQATVNTNSKVYVQKSIFLFNLN